MAAPSAFPANKCAPARLTGRGAVCLLDKAIEEYSSYVEIYLFRKVIKPA